MYKYLSIVLLLISGCATWGIKKQPLVQEGFPTWELPIPVYSEPDFSEATKAAVEFMNDSIGCEVFTSHPHKEHVFFGVSVVQDTGIRGLGEVDLHSRRVIVSEEYKSRGHMPNGWIYMNGVQTLDVQYYVISHELGHVLGLLHDPYGLMKKMMKTFIDLPEGQHFVPFPRMNDGDRLELNRRYCND